MIRRYTLALLSALLLLAALACGQGQKPPPEAETEGLPAELLITLHDAVDSLITLIDVSNGETIGQVTSGYQTWVLLRPAADELLVSDMSDADFQGQLRVYDISDLGSPKWTLPMRDRGAATGYAQAMTLSNDERYLYHGIHTRDDDGAPGPGHARLIGIIDLEARREIQRVELPLDCGGYKTLTADETSDAQVFCPPNRTVTVRADGAVSEVSPASLPSWASEPAVVSGCFGPGLTAPCRLSDGRLVLAQRSGGEDNTLDRLVVYSRADPEDARALDLPEAVLDFAPVDDETLALLHRRGAIFLLDITSGQVTGHLSGPSGARWLIGP